MSLENAIIDTHIDTPYRLYKQQMDTGSFEDITEEPASTLIYREHLKAD